MASTSRTPRPSSTTPKPPTLTKSLSGSQSSKSQKSITGFFQKRPTGTPQANARLPSKVHHSTTPSVSKEQSVPIEKAIRGSSSSLTPAPSSDSFEELETIETVATEEDLGDVVNGLPSPITPVSGAASGDGLRNSLKMTPAFSSPSRKASQSLGAQRKH